MARGGVMAKRAWGRQQKRGAGKKSVVLAVARLPASDLFLFASGEHCVAGGD